MENPRVWRCPVVGASAPGCYYSRIARQDVIRPTQIDTSAKVVVELTQGVLLIPLDHPKTLSFSVGVSPVSVSDIVGSTFRDDCGYS